MIMIDSTVWIDFFNNVRNEKTDKLFELLNSQMICIADIVLLEVLQGIRDDDKFSEIERYFRNMLIYNILNTEIAVKSAYNYRYLRKKGLTIRKSIDCIIATFCIEHEIELLHNDKDFQPFVDYLGLSVV